MQKLIWIVQSQETRDAVRSHPLFRGVTFAESRISDQERWIMTAEPVHAHTRFEIAALPGVTMLPNHHDPTPIGATVAAALAHVKAQPTETMRDVALRLHAAHGPAFHPDT